MMLDLPQDGSVLGLSGKNLLLLRAKGCDLLSDDVLRSGQCLVSVGKASILEDGNSYPWLS